MISFFPDQLPAEVSPYLKELEIRHLLTMSSGHDVDPTALVRQEGNEKADWVKILLSAPLVHKPGTYFVYNSLGTLLGKRVPKASIAAVGVCISRPRI